MNEQEQQETIEQIRQQFLEDYDNTRWLMEADKVVEEITPIMQRFPLTEADLDEAIRIAKAHGFSKVSEVFQLRQKIRRF